jgi:hypothetical protein
MTLDEAKHILSMIRHEQRYRRMVNVRLKDLQDIGHAINELSSLHSSIGESGVRSQNPVGFASRLTQLITDEQECIKAYNKAKSFLDDSLRYRKDVFAKVIDTEDKAFVSAYLSKDVSTIDLQDSGYADPYDHMLRIIRNLDIMI